MLFDAATVRHPAGHAYPSPATGCGCARSWRTSTCRRSSRHLRPRSDGATFSSSRFPPGRFNGSRLWVEGLARRHQRRRCAGTRRTASPPSSSPATISPAPRRRRDRRSPLPRSPPIRCSAFMALRAGRQRHDLHAHGVTTIRPGPRPCAASSAWAGEMVSSLGFEPLLSWPSLATVLAPSSSVAAWAFAPPARRLVPFPGPGGAGAGARQSSHARRGARAAEERRGAGRRSQPRTQVIAGRPTRPLRAVEGLKTGRCPATSRSRCGGRASRSDAARRTRQTRLFGALDSAFRDVPPSRVAGAIM